MSNVTQPEVTDTPVFVDHCSHLNFLMGENEFIPKDEFLNHRGAKYADEGGNTIISGPGECHRSNHQI